MPLKSVAAAVIAWFRKVTVVPPPDEAPGAALRLVNGLNIASLTGLLGALAAYFAANRLLPVELAARESWEIRVFFLTWLLALGHALLRPGRRGWIEQLAAITVLWAALPLLNVATTDSHLFSATAWRTGALAGFDVVCLLMAATGGYALWRVVRKQPVRGRGPLPQRRTVEDGA